MAAHKKFYDIIEKIASEMAPNLVTSTIDASNIKAGEPTVSNLLEEKEGTLFELVEIIKNVNFSTTRGCSKTSRLYSIINLIDKKSHKKICSFDIYESKFILDAFGNCHVGATIHIGSDRSIDVCITDDIASVMVCLTPVMEAFNKTCLAIEEMDSE